VGQARAVSGAGFNRFDDTIPYYRPAGRPGSIKPGRVALRLDGAEYPTGVIDPVGLADAVGRRMSPFRVVDGPGAGGGKFGTAAGAVAVGSLVAPDRSGVGDVGGVITGRDIIAEGGDVIVGVGGAMLGVGGIIPGAADGYGPDVGSGGPGIIMPGAIMCSSPTGW
jgi:hypothetical protein